MKSTKVKTTENPALNKGVVSSRFCIKCDFEIKPIEPNHHDKPENSMWNGGIVDRIAAGYGSVLDGNMYIIAICDGCVKDNKQKLQFVGNYMENGC